jgi:hypothetical protein
MNVILEFIDLILPVEPIIPALFQTVGAGSLAAPGVEEYKNIIPP